MYESEDTLTKRDGVLAKRIEQELQTARAAQQKGNKQLALRHLKQKKSYEEQRDRLAVQIQNVVTMRLKLEEMQSSSIVVNQLGAAANTLNTMQKTMDVDKIEDVMSKVQEASDNASEALAALATPIDGGLEDDDDLLAELDAMDQMELDDQFQDLAPVAKGKLPAVKGKPAVVEEDEDDLEELERMMNG
jgi:phage shock protein A